MLGMKEDDDKTFNLRSSMDGFDTASAHSDDEGMDPISFIS